MSKFRYRMQSVLDIKLKLETQAKQEFSAAKTRLDEEQTRLEKLKARKASYEQQAKELLTDTLDIQQISDNRTAILRLEEYVAAQCVQVEEAKRSVEEARVKLQEVMQERKTHEKLSDKAFDEFLQEESRKESKEVDELTSYTYGQHIREG